MKQFHVYIIASRPHGTLYVGVTSGLARRVAQHREGSIAGFTARYGIKRLVRFEAHETAEAAIRREKRLKERPRAWKRALIEGGSPDWRDLCPGVLEG